MLNGFSTRTLFAEVSGGARPFVAAAFHATPGKGRVGGKLVSEWKPLFHDAAAIALAQLELPFVFAIDANEPQAETVDSVRFHWHGGRLGAAKFAALRGLPPLHRAQDLQRVQLAQTGALPATPDYLALTYTTTGGRATAGAGRRFDSIWATPDFSLDDFDTFYTEALAAGSATRYSAPASHSDRRAIREAREGVALGVAVRVFFARSQSARRVPHGRADIYADRVSGRASLAPCGRSSAGQRNVAIAIVSSATAGRAKHSSASGPTRADRRSV